MNNLDRITVDARVKGGRRCIRGLRMPVSRILEMLAAGEGEATILANHPDLEPEDIRRALAYGAAFTNDPVMPFGCDRASDQVTGAFAR
jgi:uncharacterized protein (DUF433 family)